MPILANTNEDRDRQAEVLRSLREHGVAGIIMSPARGTDAGRSCASSRRLDPDGPDDAPRRREPAAPISGPTTGAGPRGPPST